MEFIKHNVDELLGGYRTPYDPYPSIEQLIESRFHESAWQELWNNLHHQGDVDTAAYVAVPLLVESVTDRTSDFHFYGLIGTIEIQRHQSNNPPLPEWLEKDYYSAIQKCCDFAVKDYSNDLSKDVTQLILGFLALRKDDLQLAQILLGFSRSELLGAMEEYFGVLEQN